MTPGARLAAAIDLVDAVLDAARTGGPPADRLVNDYFRARRYAGSKDRRAVQDRVFILLRHGMSLSARAAAAGLAPTGRSLVLISAWAGLSAELFDQPHAPTPPSPGEWTALQAAATLRDAALDQAARWEVPAWLMDHLPDDAAAVFPALTGRAPLDLRVNSVKSDSAAVADALHQAGIAAQPVDQVATALRIDPPVALRDAPVLRAGWADIQDANAQRACLRAAPAPGQTVIDLCAGAGGKTLALAALMGNRGRVLAVDVEARRLAALKRRAETLGVTIAEPVALAADGKPRQRWLRQWQGQADLVFADVPCSGTGTWRRNPELRWRLTPDWFGDLQAVQARLLREAATLVRPGGKLVYATCSVLPGENEQQIDRFLGDQVPFHRAGPDTVWTPAETGGDGFFTSVLVCSAEGMAATDADVAP